MTSNKIYFISLKSIDNNSLHTIESRLKLSRKRAALTSFFFFKEFNNQVKQQEGGTNRTHKAAMITSVKFASNSTVVIQQMSKTVNCLY